MTEQQNDIVSEASDRLLRECIQQKITMKDARALVDTLVDFSILLNS